MFFATGVSIRFEKPEIFIPSITPAIAICEISNFDSSQHTITFVTWEHNNTMIEMNGSRRYTLANREENVRELKIYQLMSRDAGSYGCTVQIGSISLHSATATLRLVGEFASTVVI